MKTGNNYIEWLVTIAVVLITTLNMLRSLSETLEISLFYKFVNYFSIIILYLIFIYQRHHYETKMYNRPFFFFYLLYCFYAFLYMTVFRRYPLEDMLRVPASLVVYAFKFVISLGYLLCAKTIINHFIDYFVI